MVKYRIRILNLEYLVLEMMKLASRNPPYKKYDTIDSIDIANVQNEVLNKQEF